MSERGTFPRDEAGHEVTLGDLVFYLGVVYKVTGIEQVLGGWVVGLANRVEQHARVNPRVVRGLGPDYISGMDLVAVGSDLLFPTDPEVVRRNVKLLPKRPPRQRSLAEAGLDTFGKLYGYLGEEMRPPPKPRPRKVDSLSRADLINEETRKLNEEARTTKPIKQRKGEW